LVRIGCGLDPSLCEPYAERQIVIAVTGTHS
jgi:hypothetical protein